ncbi:MAG: putative metal-binding motif-containing protein [Myxococcota bacterium]|nr:putative metal-binding motif-containing protein [Myxococcota bacterium]
MPHKTTHAFGLLSLTAGFLLSLGTAQAVTVIVGDPDGFGISPTEGLFRATGAPHDQPADVDGDGIIEADEYLPDWNLNGTTAIGSNDYFDFRSAAEESDTHGAAWTDRAVEGSGAADGAAFVFIFDVPQPGDFGYETDHYINFIFGDYDVSPTTVDIDGSTVELTLQGSGNDGLVQAAFASVPWGVMTDGMVTITVHAPNEPYLTFDYALLDSERLADSDGDGIPSSLDNCPGTPNLDQADGDGDGVGDVCDSCPQDPDPEQIDSDSDGQGDVCDPCPEDATDDGDEDGFCAPQDCDPHDAEVHPDAHEVCDDGIDNDCDGTVDLLPDNDGDGWDDCAGDCDEEDPSVHPEAEEGCDGIDNDCDGELGPGELDDDGDGFTDCDGDCDDTDAATFPGAVSNCEEGVDRNCNELVDSMETLCTSGHWLPEGCACSATKGAMPASSLPGTTAALFLVLLGLLRRRLQ